MWLPGWTYINGRTCIEHIDVLTCVGAFVLGKLVLSGEALPTDITLVRALTCVGSHVDLKTAREL